MVSSIVSFLLLILPVTIAFHVLSTFLLLLLRQARSPLRNLHGPPSPSFFMGNLREMHDQENNDLVARWEAAYGSTFVYHGFVGGRRLMTTDPVAVAHILGRGYDYPKPDFIRDALASMAAGHEGLLTVEGEDHRRQTPAFSTPHIKTLSPIFWQKAVQLRDIWLETIAACHTGNSLDVSPVSDPLTPPALEGASDKPRQPIVLPNPFSSFVSSKALPSSDVLVRRRLTKSSVATPGETLTARVDVLSWLARATLDVIGEAGFGYTFNSLTSAAAGHAEESELATAFAIIFDSARKFRVMTILQVWFPILRRLRRENATMRQATATMRRIGLTLIEQRRTQLFSRNSNRENAASADERPARGKDLLTVLIESNVTSDPSQRLSTNEILCQISTFLAADLLRRTDLDALRPRRRRRPRARVFFIPEDEDEEDYFNSYDAGAEADDEEDYGRILRRTIYTSDADFYASYEQSLQFTAY
ncbi:hypothetical protein NM688_g418 [Phlebia brevispora]|uniref:Uncharacterized protein n=1 Tax=Phlebia brevispora TaxID=194682 RepID=A0ACC1TEH9_9APHY|nr:hypothetical protein NM688_g418 [Phlebia brevispora]